MTDERRARYIAAVGIVRAALVSAEVSCSRAPAGATGVLALSAEEVT